MTCPFPTCEKQPSESYLYDMDFSGKLRASESLASVTSVAQEAQGNIASAGALTIGTPTFSGAIAQVRISGGDDLEDYKITFECVTDLGNTVEGDGILRVRES